MELLIYTFLAVFIISRLYNSLGSIDGNSSVPTGGSYKKDKDCNPTIDSTIFKEEEKLVDLDKDLESFIDTSNRSSIEETLSKIKKIEQSFYLKDFLDRAKIAFELIMESFGKKEYDTLKSLLSEDLYKKFEEGMNKKSNNDGEIMSISKIISLNQSTVENISMHNTTVNIGMLFISEQIKYKATKDGKIAEGETSRTINVSERWIFERDISRNDPKWIVVNIS